MAMSGNGTDGLAAFLRSSKATLPLVERGEASPVAVTIGNEAGDADSIVSALTYAYVLHKSGSALAAGGAILPVVSVPRDALRLRTETTALLKRAGVAMDDLVCVDEVNLEALHERGHLRLFLMDHNEPRAAHAALEGSVVSIVDHHRDGGRCPQVEGSLRNIAFTAPDAAGIGAATAGSTCSLVAEAAEAAGMGELCPQASLLLTGVILLDTANMSPAAGKATPRDEGALAYLAGAGGIDGDERTALFGHLQAAKFDEGMWASLSATESITYDYKQFAKGSRKLGVASVLLPMPTFLEASPGFWDEALAFVEAQGLEALALMFSWLPDGLDGELARQLLIVAPDGATVERLATGLAGADNPFQLAPLEIRPGAGLAAQAFDQGFRKASRKQVAPAMVDAL